MSVLVLQGARGNDGAAGAAGPPVSIFFELTIICYVAVKVLIDCRKYIVPNLFRLLVYYRVLLALLDPLDSLVALELR